jgi:hypothetical protein
MTTHGTEKENFAAIKDYRAYGITSWLESEDSAI